VKKEKEEQALLFLERNLPMLSLNILVSGLLCYASYFYLKAFNPLGFVIGVPATIWSFQTLWLVLNPYAMIFEDKIEIKKSLFKNQIIYFVDIKIIGPLVKNAFEIEYNDGDKLPITLTGIKPSDAQKLRDKFEEHVKASLAHRSTL
jgi:hypothetical protein